MTPFYSDDWLTIYGGDCRAVLAELPADSVDCVVTSPPYWGLRDYGTAHWFGGDDAHAHVGSSLRTADTGGAKQQTKRGSIGVRSGDCVCGAVRQDSQIGLERTPEEYVANMVEVFREVRRVLKPSGTCWLNLGDTYAAKSRGSDLGWDKSRLSNPGTLQKAQAAALRRTGERHRGQEVGLKEKDLVGIPWRVALALQADGWWLRRDVIWSKPNPMPESVIDRPTTSHEYLFLLTKSARYYYDAAAIAEPLQSGPSDLRKMAAQQDRIGGKHKELVDPLSRASSATNIGLKRSVGPKNAALAALGGFRRSGLADAEDRSRDGSLVGRNIRSVWTIATRPYPGAHFAVFPPELPERCIKAGSSERGVCPECGAPWGRVIVAEGPDGRRAEVRGGKAYDQAGRPLMGDNMFDHGVRGAFASGGQVLTRESTGWRPSCVHTAEPVPSVVLDPFGGSGTVGMVAQALRRRAVLVDLSPAYLQQQLERAAREWGVGGKRLVDRHVDPPPDSLWALSSPSEAAS